MGMGSFASAPLRLRMTAIFMVQGEPGDHVDREIAVPGAATVAVRRRDGDALPTGSPYSYTFPATLTRRR